MPLGATDAPSKDRCAINAPPALKAQSLRVRLLLHYQLTTTYG